MPAENEIIVIVPTYAEQENIRPLTERYLKQRKKKVYWLIYYLWMMILVKVQF